MIQIFEELYEYKKLVSKNPYKIQSYKKLISLLKSDPLLPEKIWYGEKIPGIGSSLSAKIKEIFKTGKLRELDKLRRNKKILYFKWLLDIKGIGPAKARQLYEQTTGKRDLLNKLKHNEISLTKLQHFGIKYHNQLNKKIPRKVVASIGKKVSKYLQAFPNIKKTVIAGSYRRGLQYSGDIDILAKITRKVSGAKKILENFDTVGPTISTSKKMMFFIKGPRQIYQVDVRFIPTKSWIFGLLYFTGSGEYCKSIRSHAKKQGYKLNEYGLYSAATGRKIPKIKTERDIFKKIGLPWVPPKKRFI